MLEDERDAAGIETLASAENSSEAEHLTNQEPFAKYDIHADKLNATVQGDNHGVVNHYSSSPLEWIQFFKECGLTIISGSASNDAAAFSADQADIRVRIGEALQDAAADNDDLAYTTEPTDTTEMPAEIDEWFYGLDDYERYYVVAAAVLQGAPATDVSLRARELYQACRPTTQPPQSLTQATIDGAIPARSAAKLRKRTYTTVMQTGRVARLLWQNAEFGALVLRFIAEESTEWPGSQPGQSFLAMLQQWPEELNGECSRRSARALGALLAYQSTDQLWRVANAWVNGESHRNRRQVALLLGGAYEVGAGEAEEKAGSAITASVVRLLKQWAERFTQTANTRVACAAVQTYRQIGRLVPEIALQGIEQLLQLPVRKIEDARMGELTSAIISAYVALTWAGHARLVLDALALHVERWSHQHDLPKKDYQRYRQQREMVLTITFDAFFLIAASSLAAKRDDIAVNYSIVEQLPARLVIPAHDGRDTLLMGLLSRNEIHWYLDLSMLICAALLEKRNKAAFDLLRQWAEIVTSQQGDEAETLYAALVNFMVNLAQRLSEWCGDLHGRGMTRRAVEMYRDKLHSWSGEGYLHQRSIGSLAQDVLRLINQ